MSFKIGQTYIFNFFKKVCSIANVPQTSVNILRLLLETIFSYTFIINIASTCHQYVLDEIKSAAY